jgi:hypothetical protein
VDSLAEVASRFAPSPVNFLVPKTRPWDADTGVQTGEPRRHADVYVFALLAHVNKATIDPLDVSQWRFYILPTAVLDARTRSQHSITLRSLDRLAGLPVDYAGLSEAVERSAEQRRAPVTLTDGWRGRRDLLGGDSAR